MLMPNRLLSHPPLCHNFQSHKYLNRARKANVFLCFVFFFFGFVRLLLSLIYTTVYTNKVAAKIFNIFNSLIPHFCLYINIVQAHTRIMIFVDIYSLFVCCWNACAFFFFFLMRELCSVRFLLIGTYFQHKHSALL